MRLHVAMALGFGGSIAVAVACSSGGSSSLTGQPGGTLSDGGCAPQGTAASDGQGYVQTEGCESCHGTNLAGSSTPLVTGQEPGLVVQKGHLLYPPNLTPDQTTGIGSWTDEEIDYAITEGIDNNGLELCPEMGRHYPNMCPDEATGIIAYLRSIPAVVNKVPVSYCPPVKCGANPCGEDAGP